MALHIPRMKKLIERIEKLPDHQFDMSAFCTIDGEREPLVQANESGCGTVACIAGWAVLMFAPKSWSVRMVYGEETLFNGKGQERAWSNTAMRLLGLDDPAIFYRGELTKTQLLDRLRDMVRDAEREAARQ